MTTNQTLSTAYQRKNQNSLGSQPQWLPIHQLSYKWSKCRSWKTGVWEKSRPRKKTPMILMETRCSPTRNKSISPTEIIITKMAENTGEEDQKRLRIKAQQLLEQWVIIHLDHRRKNPRKKCKMIRNSKCFLKPSKLRRRQKKTKNIKRVVKIKIKVKKPWNLINQRKTTKIRKKRNMWTKSAKNCYRTILTQKWMKLLSLSQNKRKNKFLILMMILRLKSKLIVKMKMIKFNQKVNKKIDKKKQLKKWI